jgi:hypothetical protein
VGEVDASLPSIVIDAAWTDGRDVTQMTVLLDGRPLAGAAAGRAVTVDPGEHTFRFEVIGAEPVETRNILREGEKNRILRVTFVPPTPRAESSAPPRSSSSPASSSTPNVLSPSGSSGSWPYVGPEERRTHAAKRAPVPAAAYVLGGVGLLGIGSFAYFGLTGVNDLHSMRSTCGHSCSPSDVTAARNKVLLGDILALVGLIAAGAGFWLVLSRPEVSAATSQTP